MTLNRSLLAIVAALCCAAPVHADILTTSGSTTGGPTFNRPLEDLSALSNVGTAVNYRSFVFHVDGAGEYTFLTTAAFDSFVVLYGSGFDPATPLTGALIANDDLVSSTTSGFAWDLAAGATYTYVISGFADGDAGTYSTTIGGPGAIAPVPEPAALAMMIAGLAGLTVVRRRSVHVSEQAF